MVFAVGIVIATLVGFFVYIAWAVRSFHFHREASWHTDLSAGTIGAIASGFVVALAVLYLQIQMEEESTESQERFQFAIALGSTVDLDGWEAQEGDDYTSIRLTGKSLSRSRWWGAELTDMRFGGSDLYNARFGFSQTDQIANEPTQLEPASIKGAFFNDTNLREAVFSHTDLSGTTFGRACIQGTDFRETTWDDGEPPDFRGVTYDGSTQWPTGYEVTGTVLTAPDGTDANVQPLPPDQECPRPDDPSAPRPIPEDSSLDPD